MAGRPWRGGRGGSPARCGRISVPLPLLLFLVLGTRGSCDGLAILLGSIRVTGRQEPAPVRLPLLLTKLAQRGGHGSNTGRGNVLDPLWGTPSPAQG